MTPLVSIGTRVEYLDRSWQVLTITRLFVVLAEVKHGKETGRTTRVDLSVFERLF